MNFESLDRIVTDPRFTAADARTKAGARSRLFGGYLLANPDARQRYEGLAEDQQAAVAEEFYKRAGDRYRDAFTVEVTPARTVKKTMPGGRDEFGVNSPAITYDEQIPAVRRPVHDLATEDFIAKVQAGELTPETFDRQALLETAPLIFDAAPDKIPLWQARAKQVAVDMGVLPGDDTWQQSAARVIGTLGGAVGPAVSLGTTITEGLGMRSLEEGALRGLTPENRSLVALAYPDADAFKTAGVLLSTGGISAQFGVGLTKAGLSALSRRGIALQAAADAAIGFAYRKEAPGLLAAAAGKPDDAVLNTVEAGAISGLFGVALRAIDRTYTLAQLREAVGFEGDMARFRDFLKRQGEKLSPPPDSAPNTTTRGRGMTEPAEEGAAVPDVLPDELQPIAMPPATVAEAQLAQVAPDLTPNAAALDEKAMGAAELAAIHGPALERLQSWPADAEVRALLNSDTPVDEVAAALVKQEPGQPLPIEIKDGAGVVGGSIPSEMPSVRVGDTNQMFGEEEVGFNLASETRVDSDRLTQAAFDRAAEKAKQGKLLDVPAEIPTKTPPVVKPAASETFSSSDSAAGETGGRTGKGTKAENAQAVTPEKEGYRKIEIKFDTPEAAQAYVAARPGKNYRVQGNEVFFKPKGSGFKVGAPLDADRDLLTDIADLGGIAGPGKNAGGEYDGFAETFNVGRARLLRRKGASAPDQLIEELKEFGHNFATPDDFYAAVRKAAEARETARVSIGDVQAKASNAAALFDNVGRPAKLKAPKGVAIDTVLVGDTFKVRGRPAKVAAINPDTNAVKLTGAVDQWVEPGTVIYPDKGQIKRAKTSKVASDPFNIEQRTLPRRISAPLITPDAGPVSLASIREYLSQALDIPVRYGVNRRRALGFFRTKEEVIRMKMLNDVPTLAHEVGHYLHKLVFPGGGSGYGTYSNFAKTFDAELLKLGRATSRSSYTEQQIRMEGVAEFMREYMTDRAVALSKAPKFTAHLEGTLTKDFPEIWKIVTKAREDLGRYINQTPAMKVRAMISRTPADPKLTTGQRLEKFYSDWVTELRPIERNLERLVAHGLPPSEARAVSAAATNYVGGWRGKVEHDLFKAQTNLVGQKVGDSLREIMQGLDTEALTELGDYMVAKRALELAKRRIKSGIELPDAIATARLYAPKYEKIRQKLLGFQQRNLQLLEQSGFFTSDQIQRMADLNKDYAPFYRVYEAVLGAGQQGQAGRRGFVNVGAGVRRIKGSDRMIVDPLESIVRNAYVFRDLAERNAVGRKFVAAVEMTEGGGRIADQVVKRITPVKVPDEEIRKAMLAAGVDEELVDDMPDLAFTLWKTAKTEDPKRGIFKVWKGGQEYFYQADDPELVRSLLMMDSADAELIARFPLLQSVLRPLTRIKRAGATLALEFIARNPFRDQVQAGVYSKHGFIPFFDGFRGILSALKKDDFYWDWIKNGGRYSDFVAGDRADLVKTLKNVTATPSVANFIKSAANPLNVLNNLQKISELMEMGTRIGEYRRAIAGGANPVEAANAAKDISLNFARAGFKGKVWNQIRAFFNASVQDVDKLIRAHKDNPGRTAAKAFTYITVPTIGAWYLGKDDPAIQSLPDWRKMLFWNFNMTDVAQAAGMNLDAPLVISLPKPFLLGHLYGTSVEKGLDYAFDRDPNAVNKWFSELFTMSPANPSMFVPDAGLPLVENATNYSFFRDAPIVSQSQQGLPTQFQATPQTSQIARILGEATNTAPLMIDNLVRGYGAGLGRYTTDSIDWFLLKTNLRDMPTPPEKMTRELPLLRAFVGSPYAAGAELEQFYRGVDLAEKRLRTFSYFGREITNENERSWWDKNRNELFYYDQKQGDASMMTEIRRVKTNLSELSKAMTLVQEDKAMSAETKRSTLLELKRQRDAAAASGRLRFSGREFPLAVLS